MADRTNTIIVSTNYRLGASGGLSLPALDAENPARGSGNYAVEDQVQALKWIQKTIGSFGGDKNNVTIFGQSAGGGAVCNMLATPLAAGLFDRAIIESSSCQATGKSVDDQRSTSAKFADAAGCAATDPNVVGCLRNAWPANLVTAQQKVAVTGGVVGTGVLPLASGAAIAAGSWNRVPVMIGGVRSESKLLDLAQVNITAEQYTQLVNDRYGAASGALVLAKYPLSAYSVPYLALASLDTDTGIACRVNFNADLFRGKTPVYRYEFNDPTSPTLFGFQPAGLDMSNAHSAELAYLFDFTLGDKPLTPKQEKLADAMQDYWAAFARNGTPYVKGAVSWPRYTGSHKAIVLGPTITTSSTLSAEHNCDFFATLPPKP
jgi:para-nitrobenzyl esterase